MHARPRSGETRLQHYWQAGTCSQSYYRGTRLSEFSDKLIVRSAALALCVKHWRATLKFRRHIGRWPQLSPPLQHNDKFHWRKLFDHNPLFETFCDKLACKAWGQDRCPDLEIPATLWQGTTARDIPGEMFNRPAFMKANNGSGYNIRLDGRSVDQQSVEETFSRWLARPYGQGNAEWGYKSVPRTVFVEEIITAQDGTAPITVEIYATAGEPAVVYCVTGWKEDRRCGGFFDLAGSPIAMAPDDHGALEDDWCPPSGLFKAVEYSRDLVHNIDHVRCDFLCVDDRVWFNEMTPYNFSGLGSFASLEEEQIVYRRWDLAQSWFLRTGHLGWRQHYAQALGRLLDAQRSTT